MKISRTDIEGLLIIEPIIHRDMRGYFVETFRYDILKDYIPNIKFVQENESKSNYGVLRGLHYQKGEYAQAKLVRVIKGKVLDVAVDLREESKSYGKHFAIELSDENKKQFYIPRGFAHGFVVLSDEAIFAYKCDNYYHPEAEAGIIYNDNTLNIDWRLPQSDIIISEKDLKHPNFISVKI